MATRLHTQPEDFGTDDPTSAERADEERREHLRERVRSLADMLAVESENAEPLLGPFVRRGLPTIIGAYGGHGKTSMGLKMVEAIVTGGEFLGYKGEGNCRALIIDLEQGISIAQQAVMKAFYPDDYDPMESIPDLIDTTELGEHSERIRYADWQEGVTLSEAGPDLEVLEEEIAALRPDVVMIDPVYKLFMGSDTNENVVIGAFIREIDKLRVKYGFALIMPMHPRKPPNTGGTFTMHDLYGSAIWSWWAVVVILLKRSVENSTELRFEKDRTSTLPTFSKWTLTYTPRDGFRRLMGEADESGVTSQPAHRRIWSLLQQSAPHMHTRKDLEITLKINPKTVIRATDRLAKAHDDGEYPGLVVDVGPTGANVYGFASSGSSVLAAVKAEFNAHEEMDSW